MRTKEDINTSQCDRCGKIVKAPESNLVNYHDEALCLECQRKEDLKEEVNENEKD